ncbi:dihydrofolate reductase family protein [Allorhizocola rhizosphaerae]|uniref:dihydrofolate reductase family protein n=1 Tax=Allorhizocola rhizosphaerae TaxID=1872709 RepID=UPI000E3E1E9F|nr:dihydrofolate reductase family protein [Allorhizocola rhizosphaerae]
MRKLIVHEYVSADGFAAGPDGSLDWLTEVGGEVDRLMLRELEGIDTILLGARTYELFVQFWPTPESKGELIADRLNATPKVVFSTRLDRAPWGAWPPAQVDASGSPVDSVAELKRRPGNAMVVWGSITLAQSLIEAGLVDEIWLGVAPVVLGGGRGLFASGARFELIGTQSFADTGIVMIRYRPALR